MYIKFSCARTFQDFPRVPNLSPFCVCECVGETLAGRIWLLQLLAQQDPTANKTENLKASSSWRKHLQCIYSPMQRMKSKQCNVGPCTPKYFLKILASHLYQLKLEQNQINRFFVLFSKLTKSVNMLTKDH